MISGTQYERIARRLVDESRKGRITTCAFTAAVPTIAAQLKRDAGSGLLKLWGRSRNFDEYAQDIIVHPKILTVIGALAQEKIRDGQSYHAGLIHTYGYLFSWLQTPFGYKRKRWLNHTIEEGLGLPRRTLTAEPRQGTLLQNVTWCLGQIALHDCRQWKRASAENSDIAEVLRDYAFAALKSSRITEDVTVTDAGGKRRISLRTDMVELQANRRGSAPQSLVVYSVKDPRLGGVRLISTFTTEAAHIHELCQLHALGRQQPIRPRYNCYIEGFPNGTLLGHRRLTQN